MIAGRCETLKEFQTAFPAAQAFHTGKWGWRRQCGSLNLHACRFDSQEEAEQDRDAFFGRSGDDQWLSR